ncbi:MAG: VWA domain-containing protein [Candidatus Woesearchaeota archaeon]|nr:VWA domain-containing protein [Candidatus Woesearchaeota archaeon]
MVIGNTLLEKEKKAKFSELEKAEEISGKLDVQDREDKLMRSVLESDKETINKGKLIESALDMGLNSFTPDIMFEHLVNNYGLAEQLYGQTIIRELFGEEPSYIEKNIKIPEFQRLLKRKAEQKLKMLSDEGIIDKKFNITEKGIELASLVMYMEELDNIIPRGIGGEKLSKKTSHYGEKSDIKNFTKNDRYRDIAIRRTIKTAVRRSHTKILQDDLKAFERKSKGKCYIIFGLDASGSMKGEKIKNCKKAGIALAYKAISNKDSVGLIVFGEDIKSEVAPTQDFTKLIKEIVRIRTSKRTDIAKTIKKSIELFTLDNVTKHLIILSDALPTIGEDPEKETLDAVNLARDYGITISVIGIGLDKKGENLAKKIVEIGKGRLYIVTDLKEIDKLVLEEYRAVA